MVIIDIEQTAKNIKDAMIKANKSYKDIQEACGFTTRNAIYKWTEAKGLPALDNLVIIAYECNVSIDDLVALTRI